MKEEAYKPLIHCITNPISMMQCANTILGLGGKPIMAEHPLEVKEITATAKALLLNFGNISDSRMEAMRVSFGEALERDIPVVIDAVGVSCSRLRRNFFDELIKKRTKESFLVIKGNYSEILSIHDENYRAEGVDVKEGTRRETVLTAASEVAKRYGAIVLASGATDIVTNGMRTEFIKNGCPELALITGTGCMLGAACAFFISGKRDIESVTKACLVLGIAGELAAEDACLDSVSAGRLPEQATESTAPDFATGMTFRSGSFLVRLIDHIGVMTDEEIERKKKLTQI